MLRNIMLLLALALVLSGCSLLPNQSYIVTGKVVDDHNNGVSGVTILVVGEARQATSGAGGTWALSELRGPVTIVPIKEGFSFEPSQHSVSGPEKDVVFTMRPVSSSDPAYTVSGRVVDRRGKGVAGVTVTVQGSGIKATSGTNGAWQLTGLKGTMTVVPEKAGTVFQPKNRIVTGATQNIAFEVRTPIIGTAVASREQARRWLQGTSTPSGFLDLVDHYYDIAPLYGIRADVALAQAAHETNFFRFGGIVKPWQNNFAGIGATGRASEGPDDPKNPLNGADPTRVRFEAGVHGAIFVDKATGVEAQIQHLFAYASKAAIPAGRALLSPRFTYVTRGIAPNIEDLAGRWATDPDYDDKIIYDFLNKMIATP